MLNLLLLLVGLACLLALFNWRWGISAAILVGLLQDPLRKLIPGAPAYIVLASVPIWLAVITSAHLTQQLNIQRFGRTFPRLNIWLLIFATYLLIPAALSATYGRNSWLITILGAFMYVTMFLVMVAGWQYPLPSFPVERLLAWYGIAAAIMLLGGPLEVWGAGDSWAAIGTKALDHVWVHHRMGAPVFMRAGFFRSPDVMGWHAAFAFMVAIILAFRRRRAARWLWIGLAIWALVNIWLCGRRKMFSMSLVFLGCYTFLVFRFSRVQRIISTLGAIVMVLSLGWYLISSIFYDEAIERFYLTAFTEVDVQLHRHGIGSVLSTVKQAGFWGYGLGVTQQGVHNIANAEIPRAWQESGPSKMMAELGVPGTLLFLMFGAMLFVTAYRVVRLKQGHAALALIAGLFSVLVANVASALVSAQIYGDPLVVFLLALTMGLLLSHARSNRNSMPNHPKMGRLVTRITIC